MRRCLRRDGGVVVRRLNNVLQRYEIDRLAAERRCGYRRGTGDVSIPGRGDVLGRTDDDVTLNHGLAGQSDVAVRGHVAFVHR